jgi:cytochrome P450
MTTGSVTVSAVELLHEAMLTPEGRRDPYPLLERLHEHGDHAFMPEGYVAVWGYEASQALMRSPSYGRVPPDPSLRAVFHHSLSEEQAIELRGADTSELGKWLQLVDPPEHTRLRSLVNRAFTSRQVESSRSLIEHTVTHILDDVIPGEPVDFVAQLAYPLPTQVVGELVGLPIDERGWFALTTQTQAADRDPHASFEDLLAAASARHDLARYIRGLIDERRRLPKDDLASALIHAQEAGDRLSEPELVAMILMLYIAGFSTTAHMVANGLYALLRNPDQLARLRAEPTLMRSAVEEILRFDSMVISVDYCARQDNSLLGTMVAHGTPVHVFLGAANRDPQMFSEPSRFLVDREGEPHLSFGFGAHFCLGAALARLEGEAFFAALLDRFGSIELADPRPRRRDSFNYREFESLPVVFDRPSVHSGRLGHKP